MIIYIYSTQYEIGQIIQDNLEEIGATTTLFDKTEELTANINNLKTMPHLLILDYTTYNHDIFNIYSHLKEENINLPTIFYNDPCLTKTTRTKHWFSQISLFNNISPTKEEYKNIFEKLEEIVESEELSAYIKLMQKTKPLPDNLKKSKLTMELIKNEENDNIEDFKKRTNLPNNIYFLLQVIHSNKPLHLSVKDIQNIYKKSGKKISENSLKVQISRLRSEIEKDLHCKFIISNSRGLYSFVEFKYR